MRNLAKILGFALCVAGLAGAQQHDMEQMHHMHMKQRATNVKLDVENDQAGHASPCGSVRSIFPPTRA